MGLFKKKKKKADVSSSIDMSRLPKHMAFICDGNGRWAAGRGLPRFEGHRAGVDAIKKVVIRCAELGVEVASFYCFSTENFARPEAEVNYLFGLFRKLKEYTTSKEMEGVKFRVMGDISLFPEDMQQILNDIVASTKDNTKITVNFGLAYGGRRELASAINAIIKSGVTEVTEADIQNYLYTAGLPDPDIIVRASGEQRLSNFMLFQAAYSEFYFPKTYWPDFDEKMVDNCIIEFQSRKRRFGKV